MQSKSYLKLRLKWRLDRTRMKFSVVGVDPQVSILYGISETESFHSFLLSSPVLDFLQPGLARLNPRVKKMKINHAALRLKLKYGYTVEDWEEVCTDTDSGKYTSIPCVSAV